MQYLCQWVKRNHPIATNTTITLTYVYHHHQENTATRKHHHTVQVARVITNHCHPLGTTTTTYTYIYHHHHHHQKPPPHSASCLSVSPVSAPVGGRKKPLAQVAMGETTVGVSGVFVPSSNDLIASYQIPPMVQGTRYHTTLYITSPSVNHLRNIYLHMSSLSHSTCHCQGIPHE